MLTLLMTRPQEASESFVAQLTPEARAQVTLVYSPLIGIEPSVPEIEIGDARGLIFTSANGVKIAANLTPCRNQPCYCIGEATTMAARAAGWQAECLGANSDALIKTLHRAQPATPLLHLRGRHSKGAVSARMTALGHPTRDQVIYDQPLLPFSKAAHQAMADETPVIAPLFSPRTARQFASLAAFRGPLLLAALSEAVEKPVKALKYRELSVSRQPNSRAMAQLVVEMINDAKRVEGTRSAQ